MSKEAEELVKNVSRGNKEEAKKNLVLILKKKVLNKLRDK